ncbi:MAG TPA: regulator [Pseudolysinimonas sp.]|nr:regulator [Pseudolysinimonas sp.]
MTDVALVVPLDDERRLDGSATRYGHRIVAHCSGADELATRIPAVKPQLVLAVATPQYLTARLIAACDSAGARLIVSTSSPAEVRYALSLGIVDSVDGPLSWEGLRGGGAGGTSNTGAAGREDSGISGGLPPRGAGAEPADVILPAQPRRGQVVTVWGPHGAPGRTTLAIAIAAELAEAGLRVALADADTHAASVAPSLGMLDEAPGFAAACRLAGTGALNSEEFERVGSWHRSGHSGFWVLTGLGRPSRWPELTADRVSGVIAAARDWVDVLVVDTAAAIEQDEELSSDAATPRRNAATLAGLAAADQVLAVGAADAIGLARYLHARAELLDLVAPERVTTVITKVRSRAVGLAPQAQITQTLSRFGGIDDPVLIPWDGAAFDAALVSARALLDAASRSPARLAIRSLVAERLAIPGAEFPPAVHRAKRGTRRTA